MKRAAVVTGVGVLAIIWIGPLLDEWRASFAAHMLAHMGVVAVAAPLLAIGTADTRLDLSRSASLLCSPLVVSVFDLVVVWFWHAPSLRAAVQTSPLLAVLEQASFLLAGLLLWQCCLGTVHGGRLARRAAGAFGLLFTSIHMTLLGALLTLAPRPLYGGDTVTCFGVTLSAANDQEIGGVMMLLIGAAVYLAGGLVLLGNVLRDRLDVAAPATEAAR